MLANLTKWPTVIVAALSSFPGFSYVATDLIELGLEELMDIDVSVSSISFFDTTTLKAPGTTHAICINEINVTPAKTLWELLQYRVPGIHFGFHEFLGPLLATRGVMPGVNSKSMFALDGQSLNQRSNWGYMAGYASPFLGEIRTIEVVNGPSAIVNGSGAINSFVNLVPKNGSDDAGTFVNVQWGLREELTVIEAGHGLNYGDGKDVFFYAGIAEGPGFKFDNDYGFGLTSDASSLYFQGYREKKVRGYPRPNYKFGTYLRHGEFGFNLFYQEINFQTNQITTMDYFHQAILGVKPEITLSLGEFDLLEFTLSGELYDQEFRGLFLDPVGTAPFGQYNSGGSESHFQSRVLYRNSSIENNKLAAGVTAEKRYFRKAKHYLSKDSELSDGNSFDTNWSQLGVFAEDVLRLGQKWILSAAIRHDTFLYSDVDAANSFFDFTQPIPLGGLKLSSLSPRLTAAFEVNRVTHVAASYQRGFLTPDIGHYVSNEGVNNKLRKLGQEPLAPMKPERMDSFELNFHREFAAAVNLEADLYYNIYRDQIHFHFFREGDGALPSGVAEMGIKQFGFFAGVMNSPDDFASLGGELRSRWHPIEAFQASVSFGYSRPFINERANRALQLANAARNAWAKYPPYMLKLNLASQLINRRLLLGLNSVLESAVDTFVKAPAPVEDFYARTGFRTNILAEYKITKTLSSRFTIQNLFGDSTPPSTFASHDPWQGNLGFDERTFYLTWILHLKP